MGAVLGMDEMKSSALSAAIAFVVFVGAAPAYGQSTGFIYSNRCDVEIGETLQMRPRFRRDLLVWCTGKWLKSFVIPPKSNRKVQRDFDKEAYKARHLIENFFCKLKQYRAIATRYDKTARNFLAAIHLAATIIWLN
jgi:Transposase DDE domain